MQAKIGDWWTVCCELDLRRLDTPEDVAEAQELIDSDDPADAGIGKRLWPSQEAAVRELTAEKAVI